jgi:ADP-ribosyl-[dinitrogen reductase] hydrolase
MTRAARRLASIPEMTMRDRAVGSVLGLALGDALGAPFEGRRASAIPRPLPAFELEPDDRSPGATTDDTAMARNLVRSLVARGGLEPADVLRRHVAWFATDPPGVGSLTRRVLARARDGDPHAARTVWEERGPEACATNGSVMYCGPLGVAYASRPEALHEAGPALSSITHWDERCRTAVTAVVLAIAALVRGEAAPPSVEAALVAVEDRPGAEELEFLVDAVGGRRPIDGPDMGFCLFTASVALQVAARGEPFERGLTHVVGLGGDTDTNAATAGALLGAAAGRSQLPPRWLDRLEGRAGIEAEAEALAPLAEADDPSRPGVSAGGSPG